MLRRVNLATLAAIERQEKAALMSSTESASGPRKRIVDKVSGEILHQLCLIILQTLMGS